VAHPARQDVFVSLRAEGEDHETLCTKHDEIKGPAYIRPGLRLRLEDRKLQRAPARTVSAL
jgi:hypothetical protein